MKGFVSICLSGRGWGLAEDVEGADISIFNLTFCCYWKWTQRQSLLFFFFGCVCASRWEQPAQFVVPWVALEDQNVRQWTDQWTLSATRLRQLQMNHWKTDRQTLFVTLQVMTTPMIIYTCHASDTIDNYSHSFSQFPRSIRPGDITGTCVWQISSGDLTLYSTHNVNLDDAAVRLKQIRGLRLFPFELRNKRLQRKLSRLKTLSRKACLKASLKLKIVVCDLRIFLRHNQFCLFVFSSF